METTNRRDKIAVWLITFSFVLLIVISSLFIITAKYNVDVSEKLFNSLLPLVSTWIGTVLAFYFGRENFEAAANRYQQIISRLSPEVLGTIPVRQVMIDRYTMVTMPSTDSKLLKLDLDGLLSFLNGIDKTRLPILDGEKVKYVLTKKVLTEQIAKKSDASKIATIDDLAKIYDSMKLFGKITDSDTVDTARKLMRDNNYKDVFIVGKDDQLIGWLTDTQVLRYMDAPTSK